MLTVLITIVLVVALFALMFPIYILHGWVVVNLWVWFMPAEITTWVPSLWEAVGLTLLIGMIRFKASKIDYSDEKTSKEKLKEAGSLIMSNILGPLVFLGIGAIVKFWIL